MKLLHSCRKVVKVCKFGLAENCDLPKINYPKLLKIIVVYFLNFSYPAFLA